MRVPFSFLSTGGPPPPPLWAPGDASVTLLAWYKADAGVTGSSPVTAIADQSGAADSNRDQTVSNGTLNASDAGYGGKSTISNLRSTRVGTWTATPAAPATIVVIGEAVVVTSFLSDSSTGDMIWCDASGYARFYGPPAITSSDIITAPAAIMFTDDGTAGGSAGNLYVGDFSTPVASDVTSFQAINGFDIGTGVAGVPSLTGKIAEIIVWGGVLNGTDVTNLVTYLNSTRAYGLGVT